MGEVKEVQADRRRSRRAEVRGTAVMWFNDATANRYHLSDISLDGCQLRHGPLRPIGEQCAAVINIGDRRPLAVPARVVRQFTVGDGTTGMGLAFTERTPQARAYLRAVSDPEQQSSISHSDCVVVVHSERKTRKSLADCLERLGYHVIAVGSPFEAIWALERQGARITAVLVSAQLRTTDPNDLLRFIARRHPQVKRVLMPAASSGDYPANDVHPEVDHVVSDEPWDVWDLFAQGR